MKTVTLKLNDLLNCETVERTIDIINVMKNGSVCWELGNEQEQRTSLERWITERGNNQHDTILSLESWTINS
jgi:hypothetical protein